MKKTKKNQKAIVQVAIISTKKWWENPIANTALIKGGAIATQGQCSCNGNGGSGGGVGTCGGRSL